MLDIVNELTCRDFASLCVLVHRSRLCVAMDLSLLCGGVVIITLA